MDLETFFKENNWKMMQLILLQLNPQKINNTLDFVIKVLQKQTPLKKTLRISAIFQSIIGKTFSIQKNQGAIMKEVGKDLIVLIINTKLHLKLTNDHLNNKTSY